MENNSRLILKSGYMVSKKRKPKIRSYQLLNCKPVKRISGELVFIKGKYEATFYSTGQSVNKVSKIKGNYSGTSGNLVTHEFSDSYVGLQNSECGEGGNSPSSPSPIYWTLTSY